MDKCLQAVKTLWPRAEVLEYSPGRIVVHDGYGNNLSSWQQTEEAAWVDAYKNTHDADGKPYRSRLP